MRRSGARGSREDGVVAVEFAIIFPLLMLILFGVFEFGVAWSQWQVYQGAAREGARCAAVQAAELNAGLPICDVETAVLDSAGAYTPNLTTLDVSVAPGGGPACTAETVGQEVTVSWDQDFEINIPFWKDVFTVTGEMHGTFRCE